MLFSTVVVMFPANTNPDADAMNYTVVVAGGWIILCVLYYYFPKYGGMHWFQGPLANVEVDSDKSVDRISMSYSGEKGESFSQE